MTRRTAMLLSSGVNMVAALQRIVPVLLSADFARSLQFYKSVLGFEVVEHVDHGGGGERFHIRLGDSEMVIAPSGEIPDAIDITTRDHKAAFYFFVEGVRAVREKIIAAGGQPSPVQSGHGGREEFELLDPDGHVLIFGDSLL